MTAAGMPGLSGAAMRRAGVLEAAGLRGIGTGEGGGQSQAAWPGLRGR
jgi:hypothetical protein